MTAKNFRDRMIADLKGANEVGLQAIPVDVLIKYLSEVSDADDEAARDEYRARLSHWVESHRLRHESDLELFRSVISSGQAAIKTSFTLNGGAALAMLAFIGHLAAVDQSQITAFSWTLLPFAAGVLITAIQSGCTYLSQWLYADERRIVQKFGFGFNIGAILLGLASYVAFSIGVWWVFEAFMGFSNPSH